MAGQEDESEIWAPNVSETCVYGASSWSIEPVFKLIAAEYFPYHNPLHGDRTDMIKSE